MMVSAQQHTATRHAALCDGGGVPALNITDVSKCSLLRARLGEGALPLRGKRVGERGFEADQLQPVDAHVPVTPRPSIRPRLSMISAARTDQHLLGATAAQPAGAAERPGIDNGHRPARRPALQSSRGAGFSGSDHNHIKRVVMAPTRLSASVE